MPKTFYTERDIEDLSKRGVISLVEDDDVVLTDLARDKAMRLGVEIIHEFDQPPSAPERPYLAKLTSPSATNPGEADSAKVTSSVIARPAGGSSGSDELFENVRAEVVSRLGDAVDPQLLDTIIRRVLQNVGAR
jgi:hypothetical protein